jgi:Tfp pilus assembly protein PilZ
MHGFSVFLASRTEEENQLLKRKLEPLQDDFRDLRFVGLHPQGLANSANEGIAAVVINVLEWNNSEAQSLNALRSAGYHGPVLVTAKPNVTKALTTLRAMDSIVYLEKPFVSKDLLGIVKKMLNARAVAQRVHRRFNTDESAQIEFYGRNDRYASKVCNLSKGGALLELLDTASIRVGDMVRMTVELNAVHRVYTVPARVVWTNRYKDRTGTGVGVEFVGTPDVKKTILGEY